MFGFCIWYLFKNISIYNLVIKDYNTIHNLKTHRAHITRKYNLNLIESRNYIKNLNKLEYNKFTPINNVYQHSKDNFYALQLDLETNKKDIYHISLSYRTDRPFTEDEIKLVNNYEFPVITNNDYDVKIYNCDSTNSDDWDEVD